MDKQKSLEPNQSAGSINSKVGRELKPQNYQSQASKLENLNDNSRALQVREAHVIKGKIDFDVINDKEDKMKVDLSVEQVQRYKELKHKQNTENKQLSIAELFELAQLDPELLSNELIEQKIRETMKDMVEDSQKESRNAKVNLETIKIEISRLSQQHMSDHNKLGQLPIMNKKVEAITDQNYKMISKSDAVEAGLQQNYTKLSNLESELKQRLSSLESRHDSLEAFARKDNGIQQCIQNSEDKVYKTFKTEIGKVQTYCQKQILHQDIQQMKLESKVSTIDKIYTKMKDNVTRHETLCYELATHFEAQHDVMWQINEKIEALQTYTTVNDMHLEAYLPLQTACIAYEVAKCATDKRRVKQYNSQFAKTVMKQLEKNLLRVVSNKGSTGRYRKMAYTPPSEIQGIMQRNTMKNLSKGEAKEMKLDEENKQWSMVLNSVTLDNIHLHIHKLADKDHDNDEGLKQGVTKEGNAGEGAIRCHQDMIQKELPKNERNATSLQKVMLINDKPGGYLTNKIRNQPLQEQFNDLVLKIKIIIQKPLNLRSMKQFSEMDIKLSRMKQLVHREKADLTGSLWQDEQEEELARLKDKQRDEHRRMKEEEEVERKAKEALEDKSDVTIESVASDTNSENYDDERRIKSKRKMADREHDQVDLALYEKPGKREESSSDGDRKIDFGQDYGLSRTEQNQKFEAIQIETEDRIKDAEDFFKKELQGLNENIQAQIDTQNEISTQRLTNKIGFLSANFDNKFKVTHKNFDKILEEIFEKMRELEETIQAIPVPEEAEEESESSASISNTSSDAYGSISNGSSSSELNQKMVKKEKQSKPAAGKKHGQNQRRKLKPNVVIQEESSSGRTDQLEDAFKDDRIPARLESPIKINTEDKSQYSFGRKNGEVVEPFKIPILGSSISPKKAGPKRLASEVIAQGSFGGLNFGKEKVMKNVLQQASENHEIVKRADKQKKKNSRTNLDNQIMKAMVKLTKKKIQNSQLECFQNLALSHRDSEDSQRSRRKIFKKSSTLFSDEVANNVSISSDYQPKQLNLSPTKRQSTYKSLLGGLAEVVEEKKKETRNDISTNRQKPLKKSPIHSVDGKSQLSKSKTSRRVRKGGKSRNVSVSSSSFNSGSYGTESDFDKNLYMTHEEFQGFKTGLEDMLKMGMKDNLELKTKYGALEDVVRIKLKEFDNVDTGIMVEAQGMHLESMKKFESNVKTFEQKLSQDFRRWRQRNIDLESKYENLFKWSTMFNQVNIKMKEEIVKNQKNNVSNIKQIADYMHIQILKDFQDEIDKESFCLVGLKERENKGIASPVSGNAVRASSRHTMSQLPSQDFSGDDNGVILPGIKSLDQIGRDKKDLMKAYKIAALNYQSSSVPLPTGETLPRKQVISLQQTQLQMLWEAMNKQSQEQVGRHENLKFLEQQNEQKVNQLKNIGKSQPRFVQNEIYSTFDQIVNTSQIGTSPNSQTRNLTTTSFWSPREHQTELLISDSENENSKIKMNNRNLVVSPKQKQSRIQAKLMQEQAQLKAERKHGSLHNDSIMSTYGTGANNSLYMPPAESMDQGKRIKTRNFPGSIQYYPHSQQKNGITIDLSNINQTEFNQIGLNTREPTSETQLDETPLMRPMGSPRQDYEKTNQDSSLPKLKPSCHYGIMHKSQRVSVSKLQIMSPHQAKGSTGASKKHFIVSHNNSPNIKSPSGISPIGSGVFSLEGVKKNSSQFRPNSVMEDQPQISSARPITKKGGVSKAEIIRAHGTYYKSNK